MEHNVIDNREVMLRDELHRVLPHCKAAAFALGYFFLSGYREIHEQVSRIPKLRILMSGHTNQETVDAILGAYKSIEIARQELDRRQIINKETTQQRVAEGRSEIRGSLEVLDPEEQSVDAVRGLAAMIREGRLDIRLFVRGTLHAKCYIFYYENPVPLPGSAVVGSSNLSISGLVHNSELNLRSQHPADFAKLCKWFDELWEDSVPFSDEFLSILDRSWAGSYVYTPRDVYYKALYERVRERFEAGEALEGVLPLEFPQLFEFQLSALRQAVQKLRKFHGVIIGDVVGLGKTFVGAALMRTMEREGFRPLVVCPPHLVNMWTGFCARFEVNAKVLSHGMLRQPEFDPLGEIEFRDRDLVLIDESHNFRHKDTLQYGKLYRYMQAQNRAAILVTATPLANTPDDIYNQIRLFHEGDDTRVPIPAPNLKAFFYAVKEGEASLTDFLTHLMIRRTRRFVLDHYGESDGRGRKCLRLNGDQWYFPERDLDTVSYDIDRVYNGHYEEILTLISRKHLTLARYGLYNYLRPLARDSERYAALSRVGPQLLGLMRKILLKRMESSAEAFRRTIETLLLVYEMFLEAVDHNVVPAGEDQQDLIYKTAREGGATGVELDALLSEIAAQSTQYALKDFDAEKLRADLRNDLKTFQEIQRILLRLGHRHDDKLQRLADLISRVPKSKKILVFTEYADTAKYLDSFLEDFQKTRRLKAVVHGDIAQARDLERIVRRFSPTYNLPPGTTLKEPEIDLLISTDILAEGMNLQDARVVVNYDLHWNPTRLIQRIGRVDRLSKEPMVVEVRNFLPSRQIERELRLEERLSHRIQEIHDVIGEDSRILHPDERLNENALYAIYERKQIGDVEAPEEGFEVDRVEEELRELMKSDPEYWKALVDMPAGVRSSAPSVAKSNEWSALVACEEGDVQEHYVVRPEDKVTRVDWGTAFRILANSRLEPPEAQPRRSNELVSAALREFKRTQKDLEAKRGRVLGLPPEQRWALEQIARAVRESKDKHERADLGRWFQAYQRPIVLPAARSDLRRLRRSETTMAEARPRILERLKEIYVTYDLGRREGVTSPVPTRDVPRVLYVRFLPRAVLEKILKEASG